MGDAKAAGVPVEAVRMAFGFAKLTDFRGFFTGRTGRSGRRFFHHGGHGARFALGEIPIRADLFLFILFIQNIW
jgi:hypothetical protein